MNDVPLLRSAHIRVADAPLLRLAQDERAAAPTPDAAAAGLSVADDRTARRLHQILLAMLLVHFTAYLYIPELPGALQFLVIARYMLWPIILLFLAHHLTSASPERLIRVIAPVVPYFFVGIIATFLGYSFLGGARLLVFWALGVIAAALVGLRLTHESALKTLFWIFATMVTTSVAFALLAPSLGTTPDTRTVSGIAWRGLFFGKNGLGEICTFAFLFVLLASEVQRSVRLAVLALAVVALIKSDSQGAVVFTFAVAAYWLLARGLRGLAIPVWSKVLALLTILPVSAILFIAARVPLLALLGRDTNLTGRGDIWTVWLARALQSIWFGSGPGSFTDNVSPVTADLAVAFQRYGAIRSPHNMYIAVLGEVGIFGLVALVVLLIFMATILPFIRTGRPALACCLIAFTMALGGTVETHEVFGLGGNMCLLILMYAGTLRSAPQPSPRAFAANSQAPHQSPENSEA